MRVLIVEDGRTPRDLLDQLARKWGMNPVTAEASQEALASDVKQLVVQENGKVRGQVQVASGASDGAIREAALADPKVKRALEGKSVQQVIHVPGRLVSIVAK